MGLRGGEGILSIGVGVGLSVVLLCHDGFFLPFEIPAI